MTIFVKSKRVMVSKEELRKLDKEQLVNLVSDLLIKSDALASLVHHLQDEINKLNPSIKPRTMKKLQFKKGSIYSLHTSAIITTPGLARPYSFKFIRSFRVTSSKIKRSPNPDNFICYEFEVIEMNKKMGIFQYQIQSFDRKIYQK